MLQVIYTHNSQQRSEKFGAEGVAVGFHSPFHTRLNYIAVFIHKLGFYQPALPFFQVIDCMQQFFIFIVYHRTYNVRTIPGTAGSYAFHGINQFGFKGWIIVHAFFEEEQRTGRTFLSGVAECRFHHILNGVIAVATGSEDNGVFSSGFGRERTSRVVFENAESSIGAAGHDNVLHRRMCCEKIHRFAAIGTNYLQSVFGYAGIPETFGKLPRNGECNRSRF